MEFNIYNSEKMKNNTYVLFDQDRCLVIDPSFEIEKYIDDIESRNIKTVDILLTHGHYDHIQGVNVLIDKYDAMVHCSAHAAKALDDEKLNRSAISENSLGPIKVNRNVHEFSGDKIKIGHNQIMIIATPGHTLGCTTYLLKDRLFTGDFIFKNRHGRIDFEDSNSELMAKSLKSISKLDLNLTVYPGHGDITNLSQVVKWIEQL